MGAKGVYMSGLTRDMAIAILEKNGYPMPTEKQIAFAILFGKIVRN